MIIVQHNGFDAAGLMTDLSTRVGTPAGALVSFTGYVRDFAPDRPTHSLLLEHYPGMCERVITGLLEQARAGRSWVQQWCTAWANCRQESKSSLWV